MTSRKGTKQVPKADNPQWSAQIEARLPIFPGRVTDRSKETRTDETRAHHGGDPRSACRRRSAACVRRFNPCSRPKRQQRIQEKRVFIARRRFEINQYLKDKGRADEAKLEQVRDQFFREQDNLFDNQANYINRQTELRRLMGFVE